MKAKALRRDRFKSNLERDFALHLESRKQSGGILEYRYEPLSIRVGVKTNYKVDFLIVLPSEEILFAEVKGWHKNRRDSITRLRVAADLLPWFHFMLVTRQKGKWGFDHCYDSVEPFSS